MERNQVSGDVPSKEIKILVSSYPLLSFVPPQHLEVTMSSHVHKDLLDTIMPTTPGSNNHRPKHLEPPAKMNLASF